MNDFDFEELDKAVNDLAAKTHEEHEQPDTAAVPARSAVPGSPMPPATSTEPSKPAAPSKEAVKVAEAPLPAPVKHRLEPTRPRSRGSFMDIVPPGPRKVTSRVGVSVQPVSKADEIVPEPAQAPAEPAPVHTPDRPFQREARPTPDAAPERSFVASAEQRPAPKPSNDVEWPDPLDFHDNPKPAQEDQQEKQSPEPEPALGPVSEPQAEAKEPSAEPISPFLAEAKVEKRPLGAFSNFKPEPQASHQEVPTLADAKEDELTPEPDGTFKEPEKAPLPPKEGKEHQPHDTNAKPDLHSAAMMSIPQQYRTESKATDTSTRPVFDTKEYHPPLIEATAHGHRGGGSMWGKLFIALVVLALLAVGGYFVYLYFVQAS